jgi:hypothetical protein
MRVGSEKVLGVAEHGFADSPAAVAEELVVEFAPGGGFGLAMIPVCGRLRVVRK